MEFALKLPECPVCGARCIIFEHTSPGPNTEQRLVFACGAAYMSEARRDFKDSYKNYGPWSSWKCNVQCTKATEVALDLLRKQSAG